MSWRMFLDEISIWIGVVDCPSQHGWASSSLLRSWIKQKVEEGGIYHVFWGGVLPHCWAGTSHFTFSCPWTEVYTISPAGSQTFGLRQDYSAGLPASSACRWQLMGLLSLQGHVSQFLVSNHHKYMSMHLCLYRYLYTYLTGSVSSENHD